jgi:hypothetical protein
MKKSIRVLLFIFLALCLSSCSTTEFDNKLIYKPGPPINIKGFIPKDTIYIAKVINKSGNEKEVTFKINADPYIMIPLWLWSHSYIDPVLRYSYFQEPLPLILRALFYTDIKAFKIFNNVIVSPDLYELKKKEAYKLVITLEEATWSRNLTSYGLSYPGTILWAIGLPVSYGEVYLKLKAEIYEPEADSPIKTTTIYKSVPCTEWIYEQINYSPPISEYKLADIFPEVTKELRKFILKAIYE